MKKQFVTYEIALKLKELGFDEFCFAHYYRGDLLTQTAILKSSTMLYYQQNNINPNDQYKHENCTAPLWQQVIDWFRDNYNIHIEIQSPDYPNENNYNWSIHILYKSGSYGDGSVNNYYEAREQSILKAIELCQQNK